MTDKITLGSIASFQNDATAVTQYNANNALITTALNNTLSRDGTSPNQMGASLDMNGNKILNGTLSGAGVPTASATKGTLYVRTDGSSSTTRLYINTNGTTGWTSVLTSS